MPRKQTTIAGQRLKLALLESTALPDHPRMFRRQQAGLALKQAGHEYAESTLDTQLLKMCQQGYLERANDGLAWWYRFARPDRTSERPGYGPGEAKDVWQMSTTTENTS